MRSFILALALTASLTAAAPQVQGARPQAYGQQGNAVVDPQRNYRPDNTYPGNTEVDANDNVRPRPQGYDDGTGNTQVDANDNVRPGRGYSGGYTYASGGGGGGYGYRGDNDGGFDCPGLQAVPQCCELNALGVVSASCKNPSNPPRDKESFNADCADDGKTAQCCVLPLLAGVSVACNDI